VGVARWLVIDIANRVSRPLDFIDIVTRRADWDLRCVTERE
jgi:hypothetical protein